MILQHTIVKHYKNRFTIRLNPRIIEGYVGSNITKFANSSSQILNSANEYLWPSGGMFERFSPFKVYSFVIPEIHYTEPVPINTLKKFEKVRDLIIHKEDYTKSMWFQELNHKLREGGMAKHKDITIRSVDELNRFFEDYVLKLVISMENSGYDFSIDQDIPNIMIGRNGEIHKSNAGDHRFFIAKIVGAPLMPFTIKGVHKSFMKMHEIPNKKHGINKLIKVIKELEYRYSSNQM